MIRILLIFIVLTLTPDKGHTNNQTWILGDITASTADELLAAIQNRQPIVFDSEGGTVNGGLAAAEILAKNPVPIHVNMCLSACVFILSAAQDVTVSHNARIAVHFAHRFLGEQRIQFLWDLTKSTFQSISGDDRFFQLYVNEMIERGFLPPNPSEEDFVLIEDNMFSIPTLASYWFLSPETLNTIFPQINFVFETTP